MAIPKEFWQSYRNYDHENCDSFRQIEITCKYVKRPGESCTLNNNCKYPNCQKTL